MKKYNISFNGSSTKTRRELITKEIIANPEIKILERYPSRLFISFNNEKSGDIPAIISYAQIVGDIEFGTVPVNHILSRLFEEYADNDKDKKSLYVEIEKELVNQEITQYEIKHTKDLDNWFVAYIEKGELCTYFDCFTMEV